MSTIRQKYTFVDFLSIQKSREMNKFKNMKPKQKKVIQPYMRAEIIDKKLFYKNHFRNLKKQITLNRLSLNTCAVQLIL